MSATFKWTATDSNGKPVTLGIGPIITPVPTPAPATWKMGSIVPLYSHPTNWILAGPLTAAWQRVIDAKKSYGAVQIAAVVNPASGVGASVSGDYTKGIKALKDAGVLVLGYVSTRYTNRSLVEVKDEIQRWKTMYPDVAGIFFDEQANYGGKEQYYKDATAYAKSLGFMFTVGNPGANTIASYLDTVDLVLIYEMPGLPNVASYANWDAYDNKKLGMIPFAVSALNAQWVTDASRYIAWLYLTNDGTDGNPWDSVSAYFLDLVKLLASL